MHSKTEHLPHISQVFHSLELNRIQLALATQNLLANWQSEIEVASFNTVSGTPYQKDYDAIVDVWIGDRKARFALEYEHSLKSYCQYDRIKDALQAERQVGCILYLTSGMEVLFHLVQEVRAVPQCWPLPIRQVSSERCLRPRTLHRAICMALNSGSCCNDVVGSYRILIAASLPFLCPRFPIGIAFSARLQPRVDQQLAF